MIFLCPQVNAGKFPKSQVATTCFSRSPPHSDTQKISPFLWRPQNSHSKSWILPSTRISKFRDSSRTTQSKQRNVFTLALQMSLVISGLISWRCKHLLCGPRWRSRCNVSLRDGHSADRTPVGARFSAPVQTGPGGPTSLLYNQWQVFTGR